MSNADTLNTQLNEHLGAALQRANAEGILVTDKNGLCLGFRGTGRAAASPYVASIASHAKALGSSPQIIVESEHGSIFIQSSDDTTTALFRTV